MHPNNKTNSRVMKNKKFYPWLVVALLWVVALLNYMDRTDAFHHAGRNEG